MTLSARISGIFSTIAIVASLASCAELPPFAATPVTMLTAAPGNPPLSDVVAGSEVTIAVIAGDATGPAANVTVTFAVTGGGTATPASVVTGTDGRAQTSWRFGTTVGTNTLTATAEGRSESIPATTRAGPAAKLLLSAGNGQTAPVGTAVVVPPGVTVTDINNNLVPTATNVVFTVTAGNGKVNTNASSVTIATIGGVATVANWILGDAAGASNNSLTATSGTLTGSPVAFVASASAGPAAAMTANTGTGQTAIAGSAVPTPPSVTVRDARGNPVAGALVTFAVTAGGGTVAPASAVTTDAQGIAAAASWTLGGAAGPNALRATTGGLAPLDFTATGVAGPAAKLVRNSGDGQSAPSGTPVAIAPSTLVTDANNNGVANIDVTFEVLSGGGAITGPATVRSNAFGVATIGGWQLGPAAGQHTLRATSGTLTGSPVTFTATSTQTPAALQLHSGDGQTAAAGTPVAAPPGVIVKDANGNPIAGVIVTFAVTGGGGAITGSASVASDASGIATLSGWTLGTSVAGNPNSLSATTASLPAVNFTATAIAGAAAKLAMNSGDGQSAPAATAVPIAPSVRVTDIHDNLVGAGTPVTFAIVSGGGTITGGPTVATNAFGIATVGGWQLGAVAGSNSLSATSGSLQGSPVLFTAFATQTPGSVAVSAGNNQVAAAGTLVAVPPSVVVRDAQNNAIANVSVTFAVTGGGGSVFGSATVSTDASGIASVGGWTLGSQVTNNPNTLVAAVPSLPLVTFTATAIAGPAAKIMLHTGDNQSVPAGSAVPIAPAVRVTDQYDNPVGAGTSVTYGVTSGGGSMTGPATVQTNAGGVATVGGWTLGAGANTLSATNAGLQGSPIVFTATGTPALATTLVVPATTCSTGAVCSFTPVTASGGTTPYSFAVLPALPSNLTINPSTGAITGSASAVLPQTSFIVTVTDGASVTSAKTFQLTVIAALQTALALPTAGCTVNVVCPTFTPVTASGGTPPYTFTPSLALPANLTMNASTGAVSGTATGTFGPTMITITVTDAASGTSQRTFELTVNPALQTTLAIAAQSVAAGAAITPFTPVTASGGTPALVWSVAPALPAGLSMNAGTGQVTGTTTATQTAANYVVTVTDNVSATSQKTFALSVLETTVAIPDKQCTRTVSCPFTPVTAAGGTIPVTWAVSPGLPPGLTMNASTGAITGTPTAVTPQASYTATVTDALAAVSSKTFLLTVNPILQSQQAVPVTTCTTGSPCNFTPVTTSGGTAPVTYTLIGGSLPAGLTFNTSTGAISGTPTATMSAFVYSVSAVEANGQAATSRTFQLTVN